MKKYLLILVVVFIVCLMIVNQKFHTPNDNAFGEKEFLVEKGQGIDAIAFNLKEQGFISSEFWFKVYVASSGNKARFVDGTYDLATNLNLRDLIERLVNSPNGLEELDITLLEGWNVMEMDDYLAKQNLIEQGELFDYSDKYNQKKYSFLLDRPKNATLEGYLYPDTYRVYKDTNAENITEKMLANFDLKLTDEMRAEIKNQGKTIFEVLTLASVVEKEMFGYENRRIVADIFLKRLEVGMALQSDATVNFITKKGIAAPSLDDIEVDNLYNTYKYTGLPPGPICNPSIEAIKAVVYPANTDYWYFLNTPTGEIVFSKDHDEHVANKFKYLK